MLWKEIDVNVRLNNPRLTLNVGRNIDCQSDAEKHLNCATGKKSLDEAYRYLSELFQKPRYFLYRSGHLIALYQIDMRQYHYIGRICAKGAFNRDKNLPPAA
jgi:hypothetical protein